ncbi:MAG: cobalamin-binding protein [Deltaproteobacteria bacterium]|nr:cobalamin-binding protein [Deltaproteobacteria bacterium]
MIPSLLWGITDEMGRDVAVPSKIERIVSMAPNITEILFALGVGEKVVGVTDYCDYPEAARRKPKIGGFINPNLDAVVHLEPDLVIATADGNPPEMIGKLQQVRIPVFVINPRSLWDVLSTIRRLGDLLGTPIQASQRVQTLEQRIQEVEKSAQGKDRVRAFLILAKDPLITINDETVFGSLVMVAGGFNVAGNSPIRYPRYSWEALLLADPEVLVFADEERPNLSSKRWRRLSAVQKGGVCFIPIDLLERPGPRLVEGLELLTQCLHKKGGY